jgi:hypothetical protein
VHGAAGGAGHLAVQIAAARGASVTGTASEPNHGYLRSLGAQPAAYGDGLADRVRALAPGGVDAVLDTAGRGALAITRRIGTAGVRAASAASSSEHPGTIQVFANLDQADLEALAELAEAGKLPVRVARSFPLDQAADAQRLLAQGHSGGTLLRGQPSGGPAGQQPAAFTITQVQEPNHLAWTGGDPEVVAGRHCFQLKQLADRTTESTEPEVLTGPAAPEVTGRQSPELHATYETYAAAFKKRVEEGVS